MTVRYNSYIQALSDGTIDLNNVTMSVIVVSKYYKPKETDTLQDVTSRLATFENLFIEDEMLRLSMSEIMDRITAYCKAYKSLNNIELSDIAGFVTYVGDILCFYEDLKISEQ